MAFNFAPQHHLKYKSASKLSRSKKKAHSFRSSLKYLTIGFIVMFLILAYPVWALAGRYLLVNSLDKNINQLDALGKAGSKSSVNLKNLESNILSAADQAKNLQNSNSYINDSELTQLTEKYNKILLEYTKLLNDYNQKIELQTFAEDQNKTWTNLGVAKFSSREIDIQSSEKIQQQIDRCNDVKPKISLAISELAKKYQDFNNKNALDKNVKKKLDNYYEILTKAYGNYQTDNNALIMLLSAVKKVQDNNEKIKKITVLDANNITLISKDI
jgi:hypothetical protein